MKRSITDITRMGLFVALMVVMSMITIPLSPVPFTGQVIGVFLTAIILGWKNGTIVMLIYILMGAAGFPVFSGMKGGLPVLLGPTGGYLFGFIPGVMALGSITGPNKKPTYLRLVAGMLLCLLIIYICGSLQLSYVLNLNLQLTLISGVYPFLLFDFLKIAMTALIAPQILRIITKNHLKTVKNE